MDRAWLPLTSKRWRIWTVDSCSPAIAILRSTDDSSEGEEEEEEKEEGHHLRIEAAFPVLLHEHA